MVLLLPLVLVISSFCAPILPQNGAVLATKRAGLGLKLA
jgi:hypothetical protein